MKVRSLGRKYAPLHESLDILCELIGSCRPVDGRRLGDRVPHARRVVEGVLLGADVEPAKEEHSVEVVSSAPSCSPSAPTLTCSSCW